jgi:hypothetical protein
VLWVYASREHFQLTSTQTAGKGDLIKLLHALRSSPTHIGSLQGPEIESNATTHKAVHTTHIQSGGPHFSGLHYSIRMNDGAYAPHSHGCKAVS